MKDSLHPIRPVGAKILNHPDLSRWFAQGYAEQRHDGLWLHYTAICTLLGEDARTQSEENAK